LAKKDEYVIDSSIVTKWFLVESNSDQAIKLRNEFATGRVKLTVPTLLFYEVTNALRFSGVFSETDLTLAARSLSKYRFGIWRPRGKLLELSAQLSVRANITVYDACYVSLAKRLKTQLVTEDKELLDKFPTDTVRINRLNPRTQSSP
jgi:predicted nucleic acid-binding protein